MKVGANITLRMKELRKQHKLSLQQVADRAGTTKSHIWEMENGRSKNPTVEMAVSIANAFSVSLEYLTGLSSDMPDLHPEAIRVAFEIDALLRKVGSTTDQSHGLEVAAKWHETEAEYYEVRHGDKDGVPFPIVAGWHRLHAERIRAISQPVADGWLPIETAPKDGSEFLAYQGGRYFNCWCIAGCWTDDAESDPFPTHWRPLPASPEVAE